MPIRSILAETHPKLSEEWSDKNLPLTPDMVGSSSSRKVWWKCRKCKGEWLAVIEGRSHGNGCPYCSGRIPRPGVTDLATLHPELVKEWSEKNSDAPESFTVHSSRRVWWKCSRCGYEWEQTVSHRTEGHGCPVCSVKRIRRGFNDLATLHPDLAEEWDHEKNGDLKPWDIGVAYGKPVWWKCKKCGNSFKRYVAYRRTQYSGCPFCSFYYLLPGVNDLSVSDPELAGEWDYGKNGEWTPQKVMRTSQKFVWWRCRYGHSFGEKIRERALKAKGCSFCEEEFKAALPQMLLVKYAKETGADIRINYRYSKTISFETYMPELKLAVELLGFSEYTRQKQLEKAERCRLKGIRLILVEKSRDEAETARKIQEMLAGAGARVSSDPATDAAGMRDRFFKIKDELLLEERERG